MANGQKGVTKGNSAWADLLKGAGQQLLPVLITAGSLVGFVAFAGAVIVWTRFSAAKVPPDQAVAALPQNELVAVGSSLLLLFGFFGVLAVLGVFLIDRGGRATPGMSRALVLLLMAEGVIGIVLVDGPSTVKSVLAIELFLLPLAVVFWSTFASPFIKLRRDLPDREGDEPEAELWDGPFLVVNGGLAVSPLTTALVVCFAALCGLLAAVVTRLLFDADVITVALVGLAMLGATLVLVIGIYCNRFYGDGEEHEEARDRERHERRRRRLARREDERRAEYELRRMGLPREAVRARRDRMAAEAVEGEEDEKLKPPRLELTGKGAALMAIAATVAVAGPSILLGKNWLAAALVSALILVAALWRIADLAEARFMWYGLAVFISVPLFGTLMLMARNIDDPQVQPFALIRDTDGPDEAIQGLYVTEGDDRVYFATVATESCSNELTPNSGRLLWVPKSEVVAMSIGPLQSVGDAATTSLEMAYALTPAVETPVGHHAVGHHGSLTTPEQRSLAEKVAGIQSDDHRLENVGSAVRPNFGAGWSLSPPAASPGDVVTLRMSAPNEEGDLEGFGSRREGRSLRLGGVRVDVLKERAPTAWDAEYVETSKGKALKLDKGKVYLRKGTREDPWFEEVDREEAHPSGELYVKLIDRSVARVTTGVKVSAVEAERSGKAGWYLPLRAAGDAALLAKDPWALVRGWGREARPGVETKDGGAVHSEYRLLRQAWHPDHIRFRVPENAASGAVTVECNQLAGEPLLRVGRPPMARIAVRMMAGSDRVVFSSRFAKDHDGKVKSIRWTVEGIGHGHDPKIVEDLPPSDFPYTVRLNVADAQHHSDTAEVRLLRLWSGQLSPQKEEKSTGGTSAPSTQASTKQLQAILANSVVKEPGFELEMDLHVAQPEASPEGDLDEAEALGRKANRQLLTKTSLPDTFPAGGIPVRALAYGDRCPPSLGRGRRRRVDVFVLSDGAQVLPPHDCNPGRVERTDW